MSQTNDPQTQQDLTTAAATTTVTAPAQAPGVLQATDVTALFQAPVQEVVDAETGADAAESLEKDRRWGEEDESTEGESGAQDEVSSEDGT